MSREASRLGEHRAEVERMEAVSRAHNADRDRRIREALAAAGIDADELVEWLKGQADG